MLLRNYNCFSYSLLKVSVAVIMMYFILDSSFIEIGNGSESCLLLNLILSKLNSDINWALH